MLVVTRNGRTLTGWRAWLALGLAGVVAAVVLTAVALLLLGITVTVGAVLLFVVPLVVIAALVGEIVRIGQR